jgi:FHA domain-containing protein
VSGGHRVLPGLWPIQGNGVLARQGDLVLLVHPAGGAFTDRLLDLLADAAQAGQSGRGFADLISAELESQAAAGPAGGEHGQAAVAFGPAGRGTVVTVYGTGWAEVTTTHGVQRITTGQPRGQLRCVLPAEVITLRAGVSAARDDVVTDPYLRLADGVVRAVALVYTPDGARAATGGRAASGPRAAADVPRDGQAEPGGAAVNPPGEAAGDWFEQAVAQREAGRVRPETAGRTGPGDGARPEPDFISLPLAGGQARAAVPRRAPLPLGAKPPDERSLLRSERGPSKVDGIHCKNEHFNDPEARYCAVCGIGMNQLTRVRKRGKRPPLGVLVLADGSVCQLDTDYVMGREPSLDDTVADGRARPLRLAGASSLVSRIHARVELDGWQVYISDLNSANGTRILLPGKAEGTSLTPGIRTALVAGAEIRLGGEYGFRYDSHRHR